MTIAFLGYSKPEYRYNGVATVILQQTQWLEEHGHIVLHYHLFTKEEYENLSTFLVENNVDVAVWHMTSFKIHLQGKLPCPLICLYHSNPNLLDLNYNTKFASKYHIPSFVKKVLENKITARILSYFHYLYYQLFFVYVTSKANKMVLLSSKYLPGFLASKFYPSKVTSISNACDMPFYDENIDKLNSVIYLGRLHNEHKGCDILLRIWEKIEKMFPNWKLIICGDGPDRDNLINYSKELNLQCIEFQGFTPPA